MKDFVTKPIKINQFFLTLEKWILPGKRKVAEKKPSVNDAPAIQIPDIDGVNVRQGVERIGGDPAAYVKVLKSFITRYPGFIQQVTDAVAENDRQTAVRCAHTLKGVAGNIGAMALFDRCYVLERRLRAEKPSAGPGDKALVETDAELQRVITAITLGLEEIKIPAPEGKGSNDAEGIRSLVSLLKAALEDFDTQASDIVAELEKMSDDAGFIRIVSEIQKAIDAYDYQKALDLIDGHAAWKTTG